MTRSLEGKVALVTGGSSGIGRAAALAFAAEGAKVVVADVVDPARDECARLVREGGGEALFVQADVSNAEQARAAVEAAVGAYGRLDCAFNNAGVLGPLAPLA